MSQKCECEYVFTCVFHRYLILGSSMLACVCVCVYTCTYLYVSFGGYRRRMSQKGECTHVFTCVFHRCLIPDRWKLACVWVSVCVHVHVYMYRLCGRVEGRVKSASAHGFYMCVS